MATITGNHYVCVRQSRRRIGRRGNLPLEGRQKRLPKRLACVRAIIIEKHSMAGWPTVRRIVTVMVLLMAATEIFACQLISPDSCIFANHSTSDSSEGGSGDGCLCCCAHIVIAAPVMPLAPVAVVSLAIPFEILQTPDVPAPSIEHPPRS